MTEVQVRDKNTAEHYSWGNNCDGWYLLNTAEFTVIQELMPPLAEEVMHKHSQSRQVFFIIEGEAAMAIDGQDVLVQRGQSIEIPPGTAHKIKNRSLTQGLHFLVISCPPSHGDRSNIE